MIYRHDQIEVPNLESIFEEPQYVSPGYLCSCFNGAYCKTCNGKGLQTFNTKLTSRMNNLS